MTAKKKSLVRIPWRSYNIPRSVRKRMYKRELKAALININRDSKQFSNVVLDELNFS